MTGFARGVDRAARLDVIELRGLSDEEVVAAARNDPACFEELYRRYADRVYRYALARTGSTSVADDVVGDVMVSAFEALERFDPRRGRFAPWIFTIAARRVADHHRSRQRWRRFLARQHAPPSFNEDASSSTLRDEERQRVRDAIGRLPYRQREIVLLRFVAELSIHDIGDLLRISEGAVKMRLNRALKKLASELGDTTDER